MPTIYRQVECDYCRFQIYVAQDTPPMTYVCDHCGDNDMYPLSEGGWGHADSVYYWESDGEYHLELEPEPAEEIVGLELPAYTRQPGEGLLVGLELECYPSVDGRLPHACDSMHSNAVGFAEETSLAEGGVEYQTAPLSYSATYNLLNSLNKQYRWRIDSRCGLHVNISLPDLELSDYKNIGRRMLHDLRSMTNEEMAARFGRAPNKYCDLYPSYMTNKYNACRADDDRLEFRLPAPSEDVDENMRRVKNSIELFIAHAKAYFDSQIYTPDTCMSAISDCLRDMHAQHNEASGQLSLV